MSAGGLSPIRNSEDYDLSLYGEEVWEGAPPAGGAVLPILTEADHKLHKAETESRKIGRIINIVKEKINDPSFLESPRKFMEKWSLEVKKRQAAPGLFIEEDLSIKPGAYEFVARHLVGDELNRPAVEEGLKELSIKEDAWDRKITKYSAILGHKDQEVIIVTQPEFRGSSIYPVASPAKKDPQPVRRSKRLEERRAVEQREIPSRYGKITGWKGGPPVNPPTIERLEVPTVRENLFKAEGAMREFSNVIRIVKKKLIKASFLASPNTYLKKWGLKIKKSQKDSIYQPSARSLIAKHIVRGKLNQTSLENELKELSLKVDDYQKIILECREILGETDEELTLDTNWS